MLLKNYSLLLASSSPYRRQLLDRLKIPYTTQAPEIDETPVPGETPPELVKRLSKEKAKAVAATETKQLIIGSDQVAVCKGQILGKPGNFDNAFKQLQTLSCCDVVFYTGLCVLVSDTGECLESVETYTVTMRELTKAEITAYLEQEMPYNCAGSFKAEALGISLFEKLAGNDFTTLLGLPLIKLCSILRKF